MTEPECKFCGGCIIDQYGRACCSEAAKVIIFGDGTNWPISIGGILEAQAAAEVSLENPSFSERLRDVMRYGT